MHRNSLLNLGVETIDLQQLHVWNAEWVEREERRRDFEDLKRSGKVQAVGILHHRARPRFRARDPRTISACWRECRWMKAGLPDGLAPASLLGPATFAWYFRDDRKQQVPERVASLRRDLGEADLPSTALRFCLAHAAVSSVVPGMRSRGTATHKQNKPNSKRPRDRFGAIDVSILLIDRGAKARLAQKRRS